MIKSSIGQLWYLTTPFLAILVGGMMASPASSQENVHVNAGTIQKLSRPERPIVPKQDSDSLALDRPVQSESAIGTSQKDHRSVEIKSLVFIGNSTISSEELSRELAPYLERPLTISELGQLTDAASGIYHKAGYNLARVVIPPQDIVNGTLQLIVLEGRLASNGIEISDLSEGRISIDRLQNILSTQINPADPVQRQSYERALYLLELLPGVTIRSFLYPGDEVGTTRLLVEAYATPVMSGVIAADNHGSRATGTNRVSGYGVVENATGKFERIELNASATGPGTKYIAGRVEVPVGTDGLSFGATGEVLGYEEIDEFDSGDEHGYGWSTGVFATYPVYLDALNAHFAHGSLNHHNQIDKGNVIGREEQNIENIDLELRGATNWQDHKLAHTSYRLFGNAGAVDFEDGTDELGANGGFAVFGIELSHQQPIHGPFSSRHDLGGQIATSNLNGLFKCYAGGPDSNRGYPVGAVAADECITFNNELLYNVPTPDLNTNWQFGVFVDLARTRENADPVRGQNNDLDTLVSSGLSMQASWGTYGLLRAALGRQFNDTKQRERTGMDDDRRDAHYRGWLQFALYF
ncbi:ShlB/FhaC/HecB family hemolysin secretion/activation protein [Thalassospira sp. CH_XMU1448-2]|uniref:ShlB/FhaC/HecB family hemolysin secretion/activation protein n=1 Tax=Thalassospira sp. CH_XMU1448-2 TaxID=3107773 RepID=UPI0030091F71